MPTTLPPELRTARVLLLVQAVLYGIAVVLGLYISRVDPAVTAQLVWECWPGVFALAFGLRLPKGRRLLMWAIFALELIHGLGALLALLTGEFTGLLQLILPALILAHLMRSDARAFFHRHT